MKRLVIWMMLAVLAAGSLNAAEACLRQERKCVRGDGGEDCTPFALTIAGPIGLPWGDWNVKGMQIGIFNDVYQFSGLQIGVVNVADRAYGFQIGVINVITTDDCAFLPIVNWSF